MVNLLIIYHIPIIVEETTISVCVHVQSSHRHVAALMSNIFSPALQYLFSIHDLIRIATYETIFWRLKLLKLKSLTAVAKESLSFIFPLGKPWTATE